MTFLSCQHLNIISSLKSDDNGSDKNEEIKDNVLVHLDVM